MVDIVTLILVYLIGSSVNYHLVLATMERNPEDYKEGWDYVILIVIFLFWPVVAIIAFIAIPFWAHRGFKHPTNRDHNG